MHLIRRRRSLSTLVVLLLAVAACGGDDDAGGSTTEPATASTTTDANDEATGTSLTASTEPATEDSAGSGDEASASSDPLGPANPAAGDPVLIGLLTDGSGTVADNTSEIPIGEASVAYVNEHLGGIGGRPIELFVCEAHFTPEGTADCGNQMVERGVVAVVLDTLSQGTAAAPVITAAGIPYIAFSSGTPPELTGDHAYSITGTILSTAGAVGADAIANGMTRIATIVNDNPSAIGAMEGIVQPAFAAAGLELDIVPVAQGTADMTPNVQAALNNDPEALWIFGGDAHCIAASNAADVVGADLPIYLLPNCVTADFVAGVSSTEGMLIGSTTNMSDDDPEYQLFQAVVDQYAPDDVAGDASNVGTYVSIVGIARATQGLTGDITAMTFEAAFSAAADVAVPVGGGTQFSCNRQVVTAFPAICSLGGFITPLDAEGKPTTYEQVDVASIFGG